MGHGDGPLLPIRVTVTLFPKVHLRRITPVGNKVTVTLISGNHLAGDLVASTLN